MVDHKDMIHAAKQVTVFLTDKPGELARAFAALADANVNIRALSGNPKAGDHGTVRFVPDDVDAAVKALTPVVLAVRVADVLIIQMPDRPRALLEVTERLASASVNIEYVYGSVTDPGLPSSAVFKVSDPEAGLKALAGM